MKNSEKTHRRAIWLARFWNYGYFVICLLLLSIPIRLIDRHPWMPYIAIIGIICMLLIFGICHIVIAVQWRRCFVYSMQLSAHKHRGSSACRMFWPPDRKMQREGILIGCIFIFLGCMLAFCTLHDIFFIL